jgi:hypothetical protein
VRIYTKKKAVESTDTYNGRDELRGAVDES